MQQLNWSWYRQCLLSPLSRTQCFCSGSAGNTAQLLLIQHWQQCLAHSSSSMLPTLFSPTENLCALHFKWLYVFPISMLLCNFLLPLFFFFYFFFFSRFYNIHVMLFSLFSLFITFSLYNGPSMNIIHIKNCAPFPGPQLEQQHRVSKTWTACSTATGWPMIL